MAYLIQRFICRYRDDQPVNTICYRNEMKHFIKLEKVSSKDAGTYWVKVFNDAGEVRSSIVNLNVTGRPNCFYARANQRRFVRMLNIGREETLTSPLAVVTKCAGELN